MSVINLFPQRIRRWFLIAIAVLLSLLIVLLFFMRLATPILSRHSFDLSTRLSVLLKQPTKIQYVEAAWDSFEPVVRLHQIVILNPDNQLPAVRINHVDVGINIWHSIMHGTLEIGLIHISGTQLILNINDKKYLDISGLTIAKQIPLFSTSNKPNSFLTRLFKFGNISLDGIHLTINVQNKPSIEIKNLQLELKNQGDFHQCWGYLTLLQSNHPATMQWTSTIEGNFAQKDQIKSQTYLDINHFSLATISAWQNVIPFNIKTGDFSGEAWVLTKFGKLSAIYLHEYLANLSLSAKNQVADFSLDKLEGNFLWRAELGQGFALTGKNIIINQNGEEWPSIQLFIRDGKQQTVFLNYIRLDSLLWLLNQAPQIPGKVKTLLGQLKPEGVLTNLLIEHRVADQYYSVSSVFSDIDLQPSEMIPGLKNLTGSVIFYNFHGDLQIASREMDFSLPSVFSKTLHFQRISTTVHWQKQKNRWRIKVSPLFAVNQQLGLRGLIQVTIPIANPKAATIYTLMALGHMNLSELQNYLPTKHMSPRLIAWLSNAVKGGEATYSTLLVRGPLLSIPFDHAEGVFFTNSSIEKVDLLYAPGWPLLLNAKGTLLFSGRVMKAKLIAGSTAGSQIQSATVVIPTLGEHKTAILEVNAYLKGELANALNFIKTGPLFNKVGKHLMSLTLQGPMNLNLKLAIPLKQGDHNVSASGVVDLKNAVVAVPAWNLSVTKLNGLFSFNNNDLFAKQLQGMLLGYPVAINVNTNQKSTPSYTQVDLAGQHDFNYLAKYFHVPIADQMKGIGQYQSSVFLYGNNLPTIVDFNSNLKGVAFNLPKPFYKNPNMASSLAVKLTIEPNQMLINSNYQHEINSVFVLKKLNNKTQFYGGNIYLGNTMPASPNLPGIFITGNISQFNYTLWQPFFQSVLTQISNGNSVATTTKNPTGFSNGVKSATVHVQQLFVIGQTFNDVDVTLKPLSDVWQIAIQGATISGNVLLPKGTDAHPLVANLNYLYLPAAKNNNVNAAQPDPNTFPALQVNINDFKIGNRDFGELNFMTVPDLFGLRITQLLMKNNYQEINLHGTWHEKNNHTNTQIEGTYQTQDLASTLQIWQLPALLEGKNVNAQFNLNWNQTPYQFDFASLSGDLSLTTGLGRVTQMGKSITHVIRIGQLLTILSLQSLPRRLLFDCSDITKQGFSFDSMKGDIHFKNGLASTEHFKIKGVIADLTMSGQANLSTQQLNVIVKIVPDVTANLPVIAALTGGPLAGIAMFIFKEAMGPAINHITTRYYQLTGNWAHPDATQVVRVNKAAAH